MPRQLSVMACVKLYHDWIHRIDNRAKTTFIRFQLWDSKGVVKWIHDAHRSKECEDICSSTGIVFQWINCLCTLSDRPTFYLSDCFTVLLKTFSWNLVMCQWIRLSLLQVMACRTWLILSCVKRICMYIHIHICTYMWLFCMKETWENVSVHWTAV